LKTAIFILAFVRTTNLTLHHVVFIGDPVKENAMKEACSTHREEENVINLVGKIKGRGRLGDVVVDAGIIFKCISTEQCLKM
jgi:hypothetical protein